MTTSFQSLPCYLKGTQVVMYQVSIESRYFLWQKLAKISSSNCTSFIHEVMETGREILKEKYKRRKTEVNKLRRKEGKVKETDTQNLLFLQLQMKRDWQILSRKHLSPEGTRRTTANCAASTSVEETEKRVMEYKSCFYLMLWVKKQTCLASFHSLYTLTLI